MSTYYVSQTVPGFRNSKRNKAGSLSLGVYNLVEKFSIRTDTTYHSSGEAMAREELIGSQAAGKESR